MQHGVALREHLPGHQPRGCGGSRGHAPWSGQLMLLYAELRAAQNLPSCILLWAQPAMTTFFLLAERSKMTTVAKLFESSRTGPQWNQKRPGQALWYTMPIHVPHRVVFMDTILNDSQRCRVKPWKSTQSKCASDQFLPGEADADPRQVTSADAGARLEASSADTWQHHRMPPLQSSVGSVPLREKVARLQSQHRHPLSATKMPKQSPRHQPKARFVPAQLQRSAIQRCLGLVAPTDELMSKSGRQSLALCATLPNTNTSSLLLRGGFFESISSPSVDRGTVSGCLQGMHAVVRTGPIYFLLLRLQAIGTATNSLHQLQ